MRGECARAAAALTARRRGRTVRPREVPGRGHGGPALAAAPAWRTGRTKTSAADNFLADLALSVAYRGHVEAGDVRRSGYRVRGCAPRSPRKRPPRRAESSPAMSVASWPAGIRSPARASPYPTQAALYLAGNARERDPNPLRRAREPEDPTNVEGPITDVGIGRPTRVARGVRGSSRYKTPIRRRTDRGGRNNSRKAR